MQKLILIGLGNKGRKYAATRHNSGHMFADYLSKNQVENLEVFKTDCFMNNSGEWISSFRRMRSFYACDCLFIAHDDLDIPLGKFKIQFGRGPRDHKGLLSVYQALGTKDFWHVRIGIDNRNSKVVREAGETYTLKPFKKEEKEIIKKVFAEIRISLIRQI